MIYDFSNPKSECNLYRSRYPYYALSNYENDKREIGSDFLLKLKEIYNADIYYILTGVKNNELAVKENELLRYYRQLPEQEQLRELGRLEAKAEQYQNKNQEELSSCRTGKKKSLN